MKNKSYIGISFIILIFGIWTVKEFKKRYSENKLEINYDDTLKKKEGKNNSLFTMGEVPAFELTDQNNTTITNKDYLGKVYVVEFFFSTCPTICPIMNQNMLKLQEEFYGNPKFGIASITINPAFDTPKVLKDHADLLGVKHYNWHLLTGDKEYIYNLANKGFNIYTGENKKVAGGFEHSGLFALIDKDGNIRCRKDEFGNPILYYDGTTNEGVVAIQEDIKKLLEE